MRADRTPKPSYAAVKRAIAETHGTCAGRTATWKPTQSVVKAKVDFGKLKKQWWKQRYWGFTVAAEEEATFKAGVFRIKGKSLSKKRRTAIVRGLAGLGAKKPVLKSLGLIRAYWSPLVRFQPKRLKPGFYVYGVQMTATMNPNRHTFFTSRAFKVKAKPKPKRRSRR